MCNYPVHIMPRPQVLIRASVICSPGGNAELFGNMRCIENMFSFLANQIYHMLQGLIVHNPVMMKTQHSAKVRNDRG